MAGFMRHVRTYVCLTSENYVLVLDDPSSFYVSERLWQGVDSVLGRNLWES